MNPIEFAAVAGACTRRPMAVEFAEFAARLQYQVSTSSRRGHNPVDVSLLCERRLGYSRDHIGQISNKDGQEKAVDGSVLSGLGVVHLHCRATLVVGFSDLPCLEKPRRRVRLNDNCRPCALLNEVLCDIGVGQKLRSRRLKVPQAGLVKLEQGQRWFEVHHAQWAHQAGSDLLSDRPAVTVDHANRELVGVMIGFPYCERSSAWSGLARVLAHRSPSKAADMST